MSRPKEIDGVDIEQLERVFGLLREKLPEVYKANRYFEEKTGFHNEAGTNNIVDALSHFGTLIERAEELGPEGQAEQVAHLEDHLRRSMMEAFEQTLKFSLSDAAELWDIYLEEVYPRLASAGEIPGVVSLEELIAKREQIGDLLEIGRQSKRETSWEDWEEGTGALAEASEAADALCEDLTRSIQAAKFARRSERRRLWLVAALALAFAIGILVGYLIH